jgi:hypothetical protein
MNLSEYSNGLFKDNDTLYLTPGQQVLPEQVISFDMKNIGGSDQSAGPNHYSCVVTRSRGDRSQNKITPTRESTEPDAGGDKPDTEVDTDIPPNPVEESLLESPTINESRQRDLLVTPTNPSEDNELLRNHDSVSTELTLPQVQELTPEEQLRKYVAREYMATTLHTPIRDDFPFERYLHIFNNVPNAEVEIFTRNFQCGEEFRLHQQEDENQEHHPGSPPNVANNSLPSPLLPPITMTAPIPRRTLQRPESASLIRTGNAFQALSDNQGLGTREINNAETQVEPVQEPIQLLDSYAESECDEDCYQNAAAKLTGNETERQLWVVLTSNIPSFQSFFVRERVRSANINLISTSWKSVRQQYMRYIYPRDLLQAESESSYSAIFLKLNKSSLSKELDELKFNINQKNRAELYRTWLRSMYFVLEQDTLTSRIMGDRGQVLYDRPIPWYALKAAALNLQAKLHDSMRTYIRGINREDPIAIMHELENTCGGINETTISDAILCLVVVCKFLLLPCECGYRS